MRKRARVQTPLENFTLEESTDSKILISKTATIRKRDVVEMAEVWTNSARIMVNPEGNILIDLEAKMSLSETERFRNRCKAERPKEIVSESLDNLVPMLLHADWETVLISLARCFDLVDGDPFVKEIEATKSLVAVGVVKSMYLCQLHAFVTSAGVEDVRVFGVDGQKLHILVDVNV